MRNKTTGRRRSGPARSRRDLAAAAARRDAARFNQELHEALLRRTAQMQEAVRELEAVAYTIQHDLRAPLRHIHRFADALASEDAATRRAAARRLRELTADMDGMLGGLSEYLALATGTPAMRPLALPAVFERVRERVAAEVVRRGGELALGGPACAVMAEEQRLVFALASLVENGLKFAPPGVRPRVALTTEARAATVRVWAQDNGIGVAPEHQGRIFGLFQRLNRAEAFPGRGLGLALARKAVESMGGRIGLESAAGEGSRFWIELERR